jgi:hypothetical protein
MTEHTRQELRREMATKFLAAHIGRGSELQIGLYTGGATEEVVSKRVKDVCIMAVSYADTLLKTLEELHEKHS